MSEPDFEHVSRILEGVRKLAIEYYEETGKPLGITAEMAEFEAARILGRKLSEARQPGYDAIRSSGHGPKRIQIKGRRILSTSKPGQRVGRINFDHEWDSVALVLLDESYYATAMYEALRQDVKEALLKPGSRSRNDRGALGLSKFKAIGTQIWKRGAG